MSKRTGNYCAFYVSTPFNEGNLGAHSSKDFVYYNMLRAWKALDPNFPFNDSHNKNYNVRDDSDWESTLKPRLRDRLNKSKNIILFLSSSTVNSRAIREEIDFGINTNKLPVIVVYPEYSEISDIINCPSETIKQKIKDLWDILPVFRDSMNNVPTIHLPYNKELIAAALNDPIFNASSMAEPKAYFYKC